MVVTAQQAALNKQEVIAYVGQNASRFGLDPAAVLAVAEHEGLNRGPGSGTSLSWVVPGEPTFSFGPPSWYAGGAGKDIVQQQGASAAYWSWTPAGLDYWMQKVQEAGASGLTGAQAIRQIVGGYGWGFERPREDLAAGEVINASRDYPSFQRQIQQILGGNGPGGNVIVSPPDTPGNITIPGNPAPQLPTQTNPTKPTQTTTSAKFSLHLFDLPTGPVDLTLPWDFSGILMFLAAIFCIIIGALLWKPSRDVVVQGAALAA